MKCNFHLFRVCGCVSLRLAPADSLLHSVSDWVTCIRSASLVITLDYVW